MTPLIRGLGYEKALIGFVHGLAPYSKSTSTIKPHAETRPESESKGIATKRPDCKATTPNVAMMKANAAKAKNAVNLGIILICKPSRLLLSTTKTILHRLDHVVKKSFA